MEVFFENESCIKCQHPLGFNPDSMDMVSFDAAQPTGSVEIGKADRMPGRSHCANRVQHGVCNWTVPTDSGAEFCVACRLNAVVPDLGVEGNIQRWAKLELAKRRCVYTLLRLGLPFDASASEARPGLRFQFLGDPANGPAVLTSHDAGLITMNIAEADDDERERRRVSLHEPYRTLVGHFRHEVGHYYWDRLIDRTPDLLRFRELFGNENVEYSTALQNYYQAGPIPDWNTRCVSAYASVHPWEDWAETWAHYMHGIDTIETAGSFGLVLPNDHCVDNRVPIVGTAGVAKTRISFDELLAKWIPLTFALNAINRGMGLPDVYPFVIPPLAVEKLRFIHDLIGRASAKVDTEAQASTSSALPSSTGIEAAA